MKTVISSFAFAGLLFGAAACTLDDETPDVDVSSIGINGPETKFELIIVQPIKPPRNPTLVDGDLPAKTGPAGLSFGGDYFIGGASLQTAAEPGNDIIAPGHVFDPRLQQQFDTFRDDTRPNFPDQQVLPPEDGIWSHQQLDPRVQGALGQASDLPQDLDDPCMCTGQECLTSWVDANIGCDVCAVFVCGESNPHACNSCQ